MPYYIVQNGTNLSLVVPAGTATTLVLPTGVTLSDDIPPRFAIWRREVVMVNSPSEPIAIDKEGDVRILTPFAPSTAPVAAVGAAGALTGAYQVKVSYYIKDEFGTLLAESALSPASNSVTLTADVLSVTSIPISAQDVSGRRLYRTTAGGSTFFPWIDVDGNVVTSAQSDLTDAALQLVAAPTNLGMGPDLSLVAEWRGRLWGADKDNVDSLRRTGADTSYAWDPDFEFEVPPIGKDRRGITALIRRRDELGVAKWDSFHMVTGNTDDTFTLVQVAEGIGCVSNESVQVIEDEAFFLGAPYGVYRWSDGGIRNISDEKVKAWFATDTYFNRARFEYATSNFDPVYKIYSLHLSAAGSSANDRWIYYDIVADQWYGPHKTGAFTPTASNLLTTSEDKPMPTIGSSDGFLWKNQETRTDGTATAIDMDVDTAFFSGAPPAPDIEKAFLELAVISKVQSSGLPKILTITPKVGGLDASAGTAIEHDMTLGRERLPRLGAPGRFAQLNFRQNVANVDVVLYGFEIPYHELGRR